MFVRLLLTALEDDEGVRLEAAFSVRQTQRGVGQQAVLGSTGKHTNIYTEFSILDIFCLQHFDLKNDLLLQSPSQSQCFPSH